MAALAPGLAESLREIGRCIDRRVAIIGCRIDAPEESKIDGLLGRIDTEVEKLGAARALSPDDEVLRDTVARLARSYANLVT